MTECACANYVRKSHARPPRRWPRAKSDSFNVILKYSVSLLPPPPIRGSAPAYIRHVRAESSARDDFSDIRFAARPANTLINLSPTNANRSELSFFLMIRATRAALSRDNYDTSAFRFFSLFLSSSYIPVRVRPRRSRGRIACPAPGCVRGSPYGTRATHLLILEDSLPPSDHFRYNRYRFEYRVDKLFCWHSCLREMSSRHPRD